MHQLGAHRTKITRLQVNECLGTLLKVKETIIIGLSTRNRHAPDHCKWDEEGRTWSWAFVNNFHPNYSLDRDTIESPYSASITVDRVYLL